MWLPSLQARKGLEREGGPADRREAMAGGVRDLSAGGSEVVFSRTQRLHRWGKLGGQGGKGRRKSGGAESVVGRGSGLGVSRRVGSECRLQVWELG